MYRSASAGLLASLAAAAILYFLLTHHGHVSMIAMNIWIALMVAQVSARVTLVQFYERLAPPPETRRLWSTLFHGGGICRRALLGYRFALHGHAGRIRYPASDCPGDFRAHLRFPVGIRKLCAILCAAVSGP